ncbi:MAG TPA: efflux RND transporter permease subunit [Ktedonobacteraceae bacterium]|nr:efflux RND transporter permease subunit [Ktedonobacteraceae bacterium]
MSFLSRISLANRSIVALATIVILLFGIISIPSLKQELFPSIEYPAVTIVSTYPGAAPSSVESDVTNPIEQSIQGVQNLDTLTSYSNDSVSIIIVQYTFGTDIDKARQDLTSKVSQIASTLPTGVTPNIQAINISDQPVVQLAVTSNENSTALASDLNKITVPELQKIDGVAKVDVTGIRDQVINVTLDAKKLQDNGLTVDGVSGVIQANNATLPAGSFSSNGKTLSIRVGNKIKSVADLRNLIVGVKKAATSQLPTGTGVGTGQFPGAGGTGTGAGITGAQQPIVPPTPVKLQDVATVSQTLTEASSITRTDGHESLGISVTKTTDGNTVNVSKAVNSQITDLQNKLGNGAKIAVIYDQAPYIQTSINSLAREGLIGAAFAILVILIFLLSIRSTLVTAISIPLSLIIALLGLWVGGYSLNVLTLGGLTIAIGRVVDDSIVVLENIFRHLQSGEDKQTAVLTGVKEVATAVTASTLTTVAVFLPVAFTGGIVGQLFSSFAITVTIALLASLFVALTIIPVLAYWFLKVPRRKNQQATEENHGFLEKGYTPLVRWTTGSFLSRTITIVVAILVLAGSLTLARFLQTNLFNSSGQNTFTINQQLPPGSSLDATNAAAKKVEDTLQGISGIKDYQVTIGSSGKGSFSGSSLGGNNTATFAITTDVNADQAALEKALRARVGAIQDAGKMTIAAGQSGFNSSQIQVQINSTDTTKLQQASDMVLAAVKKAPNTTDWNSNLTNSAPEIDVNVDPTKALGHGLTAIQAGQLLRDVYSGKTLTTITQNGSTMDVDLRLGQPGDGLQAVKDLLIPAATGNVKLSDIADVTQGVGPSQITHINTNRTATVSVTATSNNVGAISSDIQKRIDSLKLPDGVTASLGGVTAQQNSAFSSLGLALLAAIVIVYLVMVATFRSLIQPLLLLVSVPFAATGSILLLLATHTTLGAPALIGLLMLVGIVVTNAIVLLDLVRQYRDKGLDPRQAVIEGGRRRLRPILMTAIATILALTPMALGFGGSSGFISGPLAIVVIGGLTSSTILTLLLVPTLYVAVEQLKLRFTRHTPEDPAPRESAESVESAPVVGSKA